MLAVRGSHSVTIKALIIGVIVLVLMIPLTLLRGLVSERVSMRNAAQSKVAAGWGGHVMATGPVLVVPVQHRVQKDDQVHLIETRVSILPTRIDATVTLERQPDARRVGIYEVPVYLARVRFVGEFDPGTWETWQQGRPDYEWKWERARVLVPMAQTRELREVSVASLQDRTLAFEPSRGEGLRGIEAPLSLAANPGSSMPFDLQFTFAGSDTFMFVPLGRETTARLQANWPHPSFTGLVLPTTYSMDADGFSAEWKVLELNRDFGGIALGDELDLEDLTRASFGVGLFQPIDIYQRGERAIKYALVFIALTFLTFFAWEQVSEIRWHPLQYLLVGLALSLFYLLLIALTEHMAFGVAYAVAATALVLLIAVYVSGALASKIKGAGVGTAIGATYGFLYLLVLSESYALLLGSIAVFAALAAVMIVTRRIDWYARGASGEKVTD